MQLSKQQIVFNVGGRLFQTSRETISSFPDTYLSKLISNFKENDESVFIDRNPDVFSVVLDFYRYKRLVNHKNVDPQFLQEEFEFYGLSIIEPTHESVILSPLKSCRRWDSSPSNQNYGSKFSVYLDIDTLVHIVVDVNDALVFLHELGKGSGSIIDLTLNIININEAKTTAFSELVHFVRTTTISRLSFPMSLPATYYVLIVEVLKNDYIKDFSININMDTESAHRICDSMGDGNFRDRKISISGHNDSAVKNILARRPFAMM